LPSRIDSPLQKSSQVKKDSVNAVRSFTRGRWKVSREKRKDDDAENKVLLAPFYRGQERRDKPRVSAPFPATVRGVNANGEVFETDTHLNNLSHGALNLSLTHAVKQGAKLFIIVWLAPAPSKDAGTPRVAVRGTVVRVEPQSTALSTVTVAITNYRFL